MTVLHTPLSEEDVAGLVAGDLVYLSGRIYTARDRAHPAIISRSCPLDLVGAALYHCGPLIQRGRVLSAGPTTSGRMARYTGAILDLGVRAIIGKGGLPGEPFLGRAVYLAFPGGCGAAAAARLRVRGVFLEELGMAEAIWELEAEEFGPMVVAIDSHGRDLYRDVRASVSSHLSL
ncbi:MAG: FumA C-terminus/TtdB family hydratase beta subunit [Methanothrix sp.]|nr:FumA C-terminus/TtdB family hydratase beta subunit [Methanothrix sp.]